MFRSKSWFGGVWKPKNPHSLDQLKYLYNVLYKNQTVNDNNRSLLVETLRSIAEILIWGDQNDSTVFDFFLEKNMLSFFLKIMKQKCGSYVCVQLLQTLNILFENIRNETSLYYLLSNNHVNSIIVHKFDFSDEEVMAYYISFLKTLSLKLNSHTIHFFYNEHTNDFPLYTEAIKFFNNGESMVRIAVRTLTLNVYKVDDKSMLKFIRDKTAAPYFSNLVWFIGNHVLEIDGCVRDFNETDYRSKLSDLVAEHLDHLHYLNDILLLEIDDLNQVLTDHLLNRLLVPLYVNSLTKSSNKLKAPRVCVVLSLFLLSQVFLIMRHSPLVKVLGRIILSQQNPPEVSHPEDNQQPFLEAIFVSLDCVENDYAALFSLCLLLALNANVGMNSECLHFFSTADKYNKPLVDKMIAIISRAVKYESKVRVVTLQLCLLMLEAIVVDNGNSKLEDHHLASIEGAREENILLLQNYYKSDEMFLEIFEDEYLEMNSTKPLSIEHLLMDSNLLLPPAGSPLTGISFDKRLPCGEVERSRRSIRLYFLLRSLSLKLRKETEKHLPLTKTQSCVQLEDNLDLNNSDLLACTVISRDNTKMRRFLVIDIFQLILVEPSTKRMGWGVAKFVGFLQDIEVLGDQSDSRCLHITVKSSPTNQRRFQSKSHLLSAKFMFDDHIRCMAAKQRLVKGRQKARERKLHLIGKLLDQVRTSPSPPQNLKRPTRKSLSRDRALYTPIGKTLPGLAIPIVNETPQRENRSREEIAMEPMPKAEREDSTVDLTFDRSKSTPAASAEPESISATTSPQTETTSFMNFSHHNKGDIHTV